MQTITNVDGTTGAYTYDGLMRLKTATDVCNNIVTTHTYHMTTGGTDKNYIRTKVDYPTPTGLSTLDTLATRVYLDGIGREIELVKENQAPAPASMKDIVVATEYDNQGRVKRRYDPKESTSGNGTYLTPNTGWDHGINEYYTSPLNRLYRTKSNSWYYTTYSYTSNTSSGDAVKINGTANNYAANLLNKTVVVDESGRKSIGFTDKLGRSILNRQTDNADAAANRLDTYTFYDDKNRVTYVLPPLATTSTAELYYKYDYNGEDQLTSKKVPGAAAVSLAYDSKDLFLGYQDGFLSTLSKWYTYEYDAFGREVKQGFSATASLPTDVQITTAYGTNSYDKDKVKTVSTKVLDSATTLTTTNTYSTCGILTSVSGNSHVNTTAGTVTGTPTYDGALNVVRNVATVNAYSVTRTIQTTHPIDAHGRNTLSYFKVDAGVDRIVSTRVYNAKEQLITNYQGGTGLSGNLAYLQKLDYSYLPNGLLSAINNNVLTGTQALYSVCTAPAPALPAAATYDDKDIFSLLLYYDNPISGTNALADKSGNIVNMKWQVRGREEQVYGFLYDTYSRLTQGRHYDYNGAALQANGRYNTDYSYDKRGNILTLKRNGRTSAANCTSWGAIDDLTYTYASNTNKLTNVTGRSRWKREN